MRTLLIIFLLIFGTVHAQEVLVEGHVLDEKTKNTRTLCQC